MADRSVAASLSAYEPSWRERVGNATYDIASYLGLGSTANRMRNDVEAAVDFVPLVGDAIGFNDAMNDFNAGNYGMAAAGLGLTAAGVVPGVGDAVAAGGRKILSSGAENARIVSDMLASGRANEVTNDMISAADPSELWKLYESGATGVPMPMDQASRMARAREMGFDTDTPLYHGTGADFQSFDMGRNRDALTDGYQGRGLNASPSSEVASQYATAARNQSINRNDITNLVRGKYPEDIADLFERRLNAGHDAAWDIPEDKLNNIFKWSEEKGFDLNEFMDVSDYVEGAHVAGNSDGFVNFFSPQLNTLPDRIYDDAYRLGLSDALPKQSVMPVMYRTGDILEATTRDEARSIAEAGKGTMRYSGEGTVGGVPEIVTFDPTNIRSQFARFDPRLKHLSHLSAGLAGAVAAGTISLEVANQMQELGQDYQP